MVEAGLPDASASLAQQGLGRMRRDGDALVLDPNLISRIADQLEQVAGGSPAADIAIHRALDRRGDPAPYTSDKSAARLIVPPGHEAEVMTFAGKNLGSCWRAARPTETGKAATQELALCAAIMRAWAVRLRM